MKPKLLAVALAAACALGLASAAPLVDDTFADGDSQNHDLANNSLRLFNGRSATTTIRTDAVGSVNFELTSTSSEGFWPFFTEAGAPVDLQVGDTLSVSMTFSTGSAPSGDIRFNLMNSQGTRNTTNLTGGQNNSTFADDLGYAVDFFVSGTGSPFVIGKRTTTPSGPNNPLNSFGDFPTLTTDPSGATSRVPLEANTNYTITFTLHRETDTRTIASVLVTGGNLPENYGWTATDTATTETAFDYFTFRIGGTSFASSVKFYRLTADYTPSAPVLIQQPSPASQNLPIGGNLNLSVIASGVNLAYQWHEDGAPITIADSATTTNLLLSNLQLSDSGSYTCVVSNAGGSVTSDASVVTVVEGQVDPAPVITTQPASISAVAGDSATFTVVAEGNNLAYQWKKDGAPILGANTASYTIENVQIGDAGSYAVTINNSGGTLTSAPATLTVLSPMAATAFSPAAGTTGLCLDTPLQVTFDQAPSLGTSGRIQIVNAADHSIADTIDLSVSPQQKNIGGLTINYRPIVISGNTASIYLHSSTALAYGQTYYVVIEPGTFVDESGALFAGISDPTAWRFSTKASGPAAGATAITVAADGSGDFCTVQGAIDFVPTGNTTRRVIHVKSGTYPEIVHVPSGKNALTLQGDGRETTTIAYANNNNFNPAGTVFRCMVGVDANDFILQDITLHNTTPQGGSQAEALRVGNNAQRCFVQRANFLSYQDTILASGQVFFSDCHIEGDVDFMWGSGACYYQRCTIRTLRTGGYITQIRNDAPRKGNVYVDCTLTAPAGISGVYFARIDPNVFPYSQVVWIDCAMSPHINPVGWKLDNATTAPNVQFWEYRSTDLDGTLVDVSQRHPASRQLTENEASFWRDPQNVLGWTPAAAPVIDEQPLSRTVMAGEAVSFTVAASLGAPTATVQWYKNGVALEGANATTLTIAAAAWTNIGDYTVTLTNASGTVTSEAAHLHVITPTVITTQPESQTVLGGGDVAFTVAATGQPPLAYQWYKDGSPIAGATSDTLALSNVQGSDAGAYHVVITAPTTSATSAIVTLTVTDPFVHYIESFGLSASGSGAPNADPDGDGLSNLLEFVVGADPTVSDPAAAPASSFAVIAGKPSLVYTFDRNKAAATVDLAVEYSTDLATWTTAVDGENGVTIAVTDVDATTDHVLVTIPTVNGRAFARLRASVPLPAIAVPPQPVAATPGGSATFTVGASGLAPLSYQWYKDGAAIAGATSSTLTLTNISEEDLADYSVAVANAHGSATSVAAALTFNTLPHLSTFRLEGFASLGAGVTGGGPVDFASPGSNYVVIDSDTPEPAQTLQTYLENDTPYVIELRTDVDLGVLRNNNRQAIISPELIESGIGRIRPGSNKTLFSVTGATLHHGILEISGKSNIIIRNLTFRGLWEWDDQSQGGYKVQDWDYIRISNGSTNVWIDHCDLEKSYDGIIDVTRGSDLVTISWSRIGGDTDDVVEPAIAYLESLYQANPSDPRIAYYASLRASGRTVQSLIDLELAQDKCNLFGNGDDLAAVDGGHLNITLHHLHYHAVRQRMPRMRFGNGHVYNVFFDESPLVGTGVGTSAASATCNARILVENGDFLNVGTPLRGTPDDGTITGNGQVAQNGCIWISSTGVDRTADLDSLTGVVPYATFRWNPPKQFAWSDLTTVPYPYTLDAVDYTSTNLDSVGVILPADDAEAALLRSYLISPQP